MISKIISSFLLCLFSLVVLFPGYGSYKRSAKPALTLSETKDNSTIEDIFFNCLYSGISMADEESNTEEDEDASVEDVCYLLSEAVILQLFQKTCYLSYKLHEVATAYARSIPFPPPDLKFMII